MSEPEGSSEGEAEGLEARPRELRFAYVGGEVNYDYELGALAVGDGDSRRTISVILVVPFEGRTLAVFPQKAWDKKVKQRKLPAGPFSRPMLVEVACASATDRSVVGTEPPVKVWIGLLAASLADQVTFESGELPDISFATSTRAGLPFAEALVELGEAHFGFQSALSAPVDGAGHEQRFRALEASIARIAQSVERLAGASDRPGAAGPFSEKAGAKNKAAAKKPRAPLTEGSVPGTPRPPGRAKEIASLDPAVTKAALGVGVSPAELAEIGRHMRGRRGGLDDFPGADDPVPDDELGSVLAQSGLEDEGHEPEQGAPAVERAVLALTGIMKQLVEKKKQSDRAGTLDAYLDHAEGGTGSDSFSFGGPSGSRSKAAAYRLLRESLEKSPELVYQEIERHMDEDLLSRRAVGALSSAQSSARAWIEFRSRVGYFPTTIRTLWCLGGILDCLRDGRTGEARARTCLAIAALDQQCIDSGQWTLAQEILLEAPPPLGSFQGRRVLHDPLESFHTRLLSSRWSELLLHRVKELEAFLEAKRKLGRGRGSDAPPPKAGEDEALPPAGRGGRRIPKNGAQGSADRSGAVASPFAGAPSQAKAEVFARCWNRLGRRLNEWNASGPVTREDLGRSAGKVEKIEEQIRVLQHDKTGQAFAMPSLALAQDVVASRIAFTGVPEFDPCPYLDDELRNLYLRPKDFACGYADLPFDPSKGDRLCLRPASQAAAEWCCGVFSVPKSSERDRLIIDARPSNALQTCDNRWLIMMPTAASLLGFELEGCEVCTFSGADVREFYHNFLVSDQRSSLYTFVGSFSPADLACLKSFTPDLFQHSHVCASLRTMAMGDVNSVSFGQASHIGLLLAYQVIDPRCLLTLRGGVPRGDLALGVVIDDLVCIERSLRDIGPTKAAPVMERVHQAYRSAPLPVHQGKCFEDQHCASFWGSEVDGLAGWVRPSWARLVPLVSLTIACLKLPVLSVSLLEVLAGSWVSVVSYRRRLLSLLNHIYVIQRGKSRDAIVPSTPGLRAELFVLCALAPFIVCDMRASSSGCLVCTDASDMVGAGACVNIEKVWAKELHRHALSKGLWNRLLRPSECLLRRSGDLDQEDELPGESYRTHALWSSLCRFLQFKVLGSFKRRGSTHINVKEAESYLAVEEHLAAGVWESARTLGLLDSQVVLGALIKGRSSSPSLNVLLQGSVPAYVFFNVHPSYSFVASEDNPSDDPSRLRPIRSPSAPVPAWFTAGAAGDFSELDLFLESFGLLPDQLQGLPELLASFAARCGDPLPSSAIRREYSEGQCDDRLQRESAPDGAGEAQSFSVPCARGVENRTPVLFQAFFKQCGASQFLWPGGRRPNASSRPECAVYLGLFASKCLVARSFVQLAGKPAVTFDWQHGGAQDLCKPEVQQRLLAAAPLGTGAGSTPVEFLLLAIIVRQSFAALLCELRIPFWISGPATSLMWAHPSVVELLGRLPTPCFWTFDRCRFSEPWLKRTRVLVTTDLAGVEHLCTGGHEHQRLRGRVCAVGPDWTKNAAAWPRGAALELARSLAAELVSAAASESGVAFVGHRRVGEAKNPGPPKRVPRRGSLFDVELIEASTLRVRAQIWTVFIAWLREGLSEGAVLGIFRCPPLLSLMLRDYGDVLYRTGFPLGSYRQLLAHAQKLLPLLKPHMAVAWNMVTRWQELQPVCHRTPLPEALLRAMVGLAFSHGWKVWAATTLVMFYFICRPGEVLRALRRDLLTPGDTLEPHHKWLYLRIRAPKTKRRGAKIQHAKLDDPIALEIALSVWEQLPRGRALYPGSPSAYRRRWDVLLRTLGIPATAALTPASVRAGGAICAFQRGTAVTDLMWRMRLKSQVTLEHYLQEMTGFSVLPSLPAEARRRIKVANCFFRAVEERAIYCKAARVAACDGVEAAA
ncbi:unnamed protein product [Symbiodinium sp. CCMP2456]|nr:unnamed protein product [Symbiodinium sp. CCMP2456]